MEDSEMTRRHLLIACFVSIVLAASSQAALLLKHGSTSNIIRVVLKSSLTGQGLIGLDHTSDGLIIATAASNENATEAVEYREADSEIESISEPGAYDPPANGTCRFKQVDPDNHPGLYEIQLADSRFNVTGAKTLVITVSGAANLLSTDYEVQFVGYDPTASAIAANVTQWNSQNLGAQQQNGFPTVTIKDGTGTGEIDTHDGLAPADVQRFFDDDDTTNNVGSFFNGGGYGHVLLGATVVDQTSGTTFELSAGPINDGALDDHVIVVHYYDSGPKTHVDTITSYTEDGGDYYVTVDEGVVGSVVGARVEVLAESPRIAAIESKTSFLPDAAAGSSGGLFIAGTNAQTTVTNGFGSGTISRASFATDTGLQTIRSGTSLAAGSPTSIKLDSGASLSNDFYKHSYVLITSGQGAGQYRLITGYTANDQVATVTPNWITGQEPASGSTFAILPAGIANVEAWRGDLVVPATVPGVPEVDVTHVGGEQVCD
jgi:hypothetical protein